MQSSKSRPLALSHCRDFMLRVWSNIRWYQICFYVGSYNHVGLADNSAADSAAKAVQLLPVSSLTVPHSDYTSLVRIQAPRVNVINMLYVIRLPRRYEICIHRLRIGHTYLTHGHLLRGETPPHCLACQVDLTVEHILLHCVSFTNARDDCFCVTLTSMSEFIFRKSPRVI